jgi:PST family polysaccharide transporter
VNGEQAAPLRTEAAPDSGATPPRSGAIVRAPAAWAFFMNFGQQVTTFVVALVLAGILGPRNYGVVAIATIYLSFVQLSLDQGLAVAIVQRKHLERRHLDSAFWLNMMWAVLLVVISAALASWWARVNGSQQLAHVIYALSFLIPLQALTIVQQAVLQRELKFKRLSLRTTVAGILGGIVGVAAALLGAGVWSLVAQQLVVGVVGVILLWIVADWRPSFRFSTSHARELLGFSMQVFVGNLGTWITRRVDVVLMGIFFGPFTVGLYRLGDRMVDALLDLGSRPVQMYALPHLSRLQNDPDGLRRATRAVIRLGAMATVPLMLIMAACAPQLTAALGPHWETATIALQLLAIVGITKALIVFEAAVLFAVGRPRTRAVVIWSLATISIVTSVAVAYKLRDATTHHEIAWMAMSRVLLFVGIFTPVNLIVIARATGSRVLPLASELVRPVCAGLAAVVTVAGMDRLGFLDGPALVNLAVAGIVATVVCAGVLLLIDSALRTLVGEAVQKLRTRPWRGEPIAAPTTE